MGKLIILSGPSGVGKDTVIDELMKSGRFVKVTTSTSRPKREEEKSDSYEFLSKEQFEKAILNEEFLEYAVYDGNYYGTPRMGLVAALSGHKDVILRIDVQGFQDIKDSRINVYKSVFILPPNIKTLRERLLSRKTETQEQFDERMKTAIEEIEISHAYDLRVTNDTLDRCVKEILQSI